MDAPDRREPRPGCRWGALALCASAAGCTGAPLSILDPAGPTAEPITRIWWAMFWGGAAILILMVVLWLRAFSARPERRQLPAKLFLLGGGFFFPLSVLSVLLVHGLRMGHALLPTAAAEPVYRIEVVARQWWWEVAYLDAEGGPLYSANEIYIPVDRPVDVHVRSADVIHSFWVPRLGGKIDAIPGRTNVIRLRAAEPGIYRGQCSEYCGAQHARMALLVEALHEQALTERLSGMAAGAPREPTIEATSAATELFMQRCSECHTREAKERGTGLGPNLGDFTRRRTIGAGTVPNTPAALREWLAAHQQLKPGNRMPHDETLDTADLERLARLIEGR